MALRRILFSVIGLGCSWLGASSADAQVFFARGVQPIAVVHFDGEPKTAADDAWRRELQYYESANRMYAAQQQYRANQIAAYRAIQAQWQAQRAWEAQQRALRNVRPVPRLVAKKKP